MTDEGLAAQRALYPEVPNLPPPMVTKLVTNIPPPCEARQGPEGTTKPN
jgi:hypothetical protein